MNESKPCPPELKCAQRGVHQPGCPNDVAYGIRFAIGEAGSAPFNGTPVTIAICGDTSHEHDFFGPGSFERAFDDGHGSERACRCGAGAMAESMGYLP